MTPPTVSYSWPEGKTPFLLRDVPAALVYALTFFVALGLLLAVLTL